MERIFGEPAVREWRRVGTSVGRSLALDINVELYRDWDTVQRTDGRVVLQRYVCLLCFPQGVVCHHMHNGIQMRIDLGDTI